LYMLLRFQKAVVRGNYDTGNQAFSMRLRFLTIRDHAGRNTESRQVGGERQVLFHPCTSPALHVHHVVKRTCASKLWIMLGTQ
jgi:hypothetical protein